MSSHAPAHRRGLLQFSPLATSDAVFPLFICTMTTPFPPSHAPEVMRRSALILTVLVVGLAIAGYVFFNGERKAPVRYRSASIERGSVISLVTATGSINPVVSVQVGTQVSGMIKSLHADFNSVVKTGDIVAVIDPEPFKARRDQAVSNLEMARANVARTRTELAQRRRELDRAKSLIEQQFVSQNDVDVAITNFQGAEAQVNVSSAQVRQAEAHSMPRTRFEVPVIRSPVNGIVVARNVESARRSQPASRRQICPDRPRSHEDAGRYERQRVRHRRHAEGKEATFTCGCLSGYQFFRHDSTKCGSLRSMCRMS